MIEEKLKNKHEITIFINGEEKEVAKEKISYEEVIRLAFGHYEDNDSINYTVIYFKGNNEKRNRCLADHDNDDVWQTSRLLKTVVLNRG